MTSWIESVLGGALPREGEKAKFGGQSAELIDGVLTFSDDHEAGQGQTSEAFGFKGGSRTLTFRQRSGTPPESGSSSASAAGPS